MKIEMYEFKPHALRFRDRIRGTITMPRDAKILYLGAGPPRGNVYAWCEVSSIVPVVPDLVVHEYIILTHKDEVPPGHEFVGPIFATPILFLYELRDANVFDEFARNQPAVPSAIQLIPGGKRG